MGVDGKDMSEEQFGRFDQSRYQEMYGRGMNRYEISCTLGHINVWKKIQAEGIEKALILEDDVCILGVVPKLNDVIEDRKPYFDILYLHHGKAKKWPIYLGLPEGYRLYRYRRPTSKSRRGITYATAYMITRHAADILVKNASLHMMPADFIVGLLQHHKLLTLGIEPCCVDHDHFETSTPGRF